ncbi:hypothetical protein H2203_006018 [Taxawa tesnikishii (nom. ined.)]|nr:hypothetical protein H2203_006018 [Dothideales sp. JES 119]
MVLEGATASAEGFVEDAPSSDVDPYASDSPYPTASSPGVSSPAASGRTPGGAPYTQEVDLDVNKLPKPFRFLGAGPGLNQSTIRAIRDQCQFAANLLQRPLRQEEVDSLGYHFARGMRVASYGAPVGVSAGLLYAYATRSKWRFPFYTAKEGTAFNPNKVLSLEGPRARAIWHILRFQSYGFIGFILGGIFFSSYAVSINAAGKATDPRLKDFNQALNQRMKEGARAPPLRPPMGQRSSVDTQEGRMDQQVERVRRDLQNRPRGQRQDDDDMSPTSGTFANDYPDASSDTGLMSDAQMRSQEQRQQADARTSPAQNRENTFRMDKVTTQPRNFDSDDASPTAGSTSPGKSYPAGSAWERVRREAAVGQQPSKGSTGNAWAGNRGVQQEQREGSTLGDSFSFSETEEERQLAKTEAQKDFDARVERERQGGDFNEEKRGRRW